jgi:hypothetical protein
MSRARHRLPRYLVRGPPLGLARGLPRGWVGQRQVLLLAGPQPQGQQPGCRCMVASRA